MGSSGFQPCNSTLGIWSSAPVPRTTPGSGSGSGWPRAGPHAGPIPTPRHSSREVWLHPTGCAGQGRGWVAPWGGLGFSARTHATVSTAPGEERRWEKSHETGLRVMSMEMNWRTPSGWGAMLPCHRGPTGMLGAEGKRRTLWLPRLKQCGTLGTGQSQHQLDYLGCKRETH